MCVKGINANTTLKCSEHGFKVLDEDTAHKNNYDPKKKGKKINELVPYVESGQLKQENADSSDRSSGVKSGTFIFTYNDGLISVDDGC